jgi:ELWxxDGT repeat protein
VWRTDGTEAGTQILSSALTGGFGGMSGLAVMGGHLYLTAWTGAGLELWRSDGTSGGTAAVASICPSPSYCAT